MHFLFLLLFFFFIVSTATFAAPLPEDLHVIEAFKKGMIQFGDQPSNDPDKHYTTVVSMYFSLGKAKHSQGDYQKWISNFLVSVKSPLVMVTDQNSVDMLRSLRPNHLPTTFILVDSIWTITKFIENERHKDYTSNYQNKQHGLDREAYIHNPHLYAIWNSKIWLVRILAHWNIYSSSFFIYSDAGAWRTNRFEQDSQWPLAIFTHELSLFLGDRVLVGQISGDAYFSKTDKDAPYQREGHFLPNYQRDFIEGTFFAVGVSGIDSFYQKFYELHDLRMSQNQFVGSDQNTLNILVYENKPMFVHLITARCDGKTYAYHYDPWFFFQHFFRKDQYCDNARLSMLKWY